MDSIEAAAYNMAVQAKAAATTVARLQRTDGYTIIASNPGMYSTGQYGTTPVDVTYRSRHVATANATRIRLLYGNFTSLGVGTIAEPYSDITVGAALQKAGATPSDKTGFQVPTSFRNGRTETAVGRGALTLSEPAFFSVAKGEAFYINTHVSSFLAPGPSAPTLGEVLTGGALVGGATYNICVVYVFGNGDESAASAGTALVTTSGANTRSITVTSPSAAAGATGWRVYMTARNASIAGQYYRSPVTAAIGATLTITAEISSNNTRQTKAGGYMGVPGGNALFGNTGFAGLDTGEGQGSGDLTFQGGATADATPGNAYLPLAILGKVDGTPPPTVALIGDSIQAGTGDLGFFTNGGHSTRAVTNQLGLKFDKSIAPLYGYVRVPLGSEQAQTFAATLNTNQYNRSRLSVTEYASNVISNYGTNDTGSGLPALKTAILQIASWYTSRGIKFFQCTLLPATTSTNGFVDVAGQTVRASESVRLAFNAWLRDASSNGFRAQAGGALVEVIDINKYVEVNASNVLNQDGGFWRVPPSTVYASGTFTSVTFPYQFTDSNLAAPANTYMGYNILVTSGAAAGKQGCIYYQTSGGIINTSATIGATPAVGDSYQIMLLSTIDGIHPSSQGHIWAAQAIQEAFPLLQN